jgi:hypothetical protein
VCSKSCGCSFTLQYLVAKLKSTVPSYYCSIAAPVSRLNLTFNFSCAPSRLESACLCSSLKQIRPTTGRKILRLRFVVIRLAVAEALQTDDKFTKLTACMFTIRPKHGRYTPFTGFVSFPGRGQHRLRTHKDKTELVIIHLVFVLY